MLGGSFLLFIVTAILVSGCQLLVPFPPPATDAGDRDGDLEPDGDGDTDTDGDSPSVCGDRLCDDDEDAESCPDDCSPACGDGLCTHAEDARDCSDDCPESCGDALCTHEETPESCADDCLAVCGDGACTHDEDADICPEDCRATCGDSACTHDEVAETCPEDIIWSRKPIPLKLCGETFVFDDLRSHLQETLDIGKDHFVEFVYRDTNPLTGDMTDRVAQTCDMIRDLTGHPEGTRG